MMRNQQYRQRTPFCFYFFFLLLWWMSCVEKFVSKPIYSIRLLIWCIVYTVQCTVYTFQYLCFIDSSIELKLCKLNQFNQACLHVKPEGAKIMNKARTSEQKYMKIIIVENFSLRWSSWWIFCFFFLFIFIHCLAMISCFISDIYFDSCFIFLKVAINLFHKFLNENIHIVIE